MLERKDLTTDFETLVNRAFADFPFLADFQIPHVPSHGTPALDAYEKDGKYLLELAVPGYDVKDINVEINGATVTIYGNRKESTEKKADRYYRRELRTGTFMRSVTLPQDLEADTVDAVLAKGVLTLTLTPTKPIAAKKIAIKGA